MKNYLSTMFQISDILVDKDEVAMALHLSVPVDEHAEADKISGSNPENSGSFSHTEIIMRKVGQILSAQGFPCFSCHRSRYKLLPLSPDCKNKLFMFDSMEKRYLLTICCEENRKMELFRFELKLSEVCLLYTSPSPRD